MMRRTGFKPRAPRREARDPDRLRSMPTVTPGAFRAPHPVATTPAEPVTKDAPVRSEAYRRAVASLPCIACGIQGYSQAAHLPPEAKGMKQSDLLTFPLCCARLVRSARPLRRAQDGMLAAIARFPGAPKRADVLAALKEGG